MEVPTDYIEGYRKARMLNPAAAYNYMVHTTYGDPEADYVVESLMPLGQEVSSRLIQAGMNGDEGALREAPARLRDFFMRIEEPPDWVDTTSFAPGIRMFHRNSQLILGAFVGGTLVEGFSTNIGKSFFITGRLRDQGVRRLKQNNRHLVEIFMPGGLDRNGDGWKLSVRIRLIHAQVRYLLNNSWDWDWNAWGMPLSAAHIGFALCAFSARLLKHLKSLGAKFSDEERASFMQVWRYSGYLMGVPESILYRNEEQADRLFEIGNMCEPPPDLESIAMANALLNSAPLIIGIDEPIERRNLVKYIYRISRALIGDPLADQLRYDKGLSFGTLAFFRIQSRYSYILNNLINMRGGGVEFKNFTSLLDASVFDEAGITYRMPDHVYDERSSEW